MKNPKTFPCSTGKKQHFSSFFHGFFPTFFVMFGMIFPNSEDDGLETRVPTTRPSPRQARTECLGCLGRVVLFFLCGSHPRGDNTLNHSYIYIDNHSYIYIYTHVLLSQISYESPRKFLKHGGCTSFSTTYLRRFGMGLFFF